MVNAQGNQNQTTSITNNKQNHTVPWIGIYGVNVTKGIANVLGIKVPSGILVTDVDPDSPAEKAGLRGGNELAIIDGKRIKLGGDIIAKADNKTIINSDELFESVLRNKEPGDNLKLTILRDSQERRINIIVGSIPAAKYVNASNYTNPNNVKFLSYEDIDLGIQLQYPSDWVVNEEYIGNIKFSSPYENPSDKFREKLDILATSYKSKKTLDQIENEDINYGRANLTDFSLTSKPNANTAAPLIGSPSRTLVFTFTHPNYGEVKVLHLYTIKNGIRYDLIYTAKPERYDNYLPTIQKMINSFNIIELSEYENFDLGIRMKYPSYWRIAEENQSSYSPATFESGQNITLFPGTENNSTMFRERLEIFVSRPYRNPSLAEESFNQTLEYYKSPPVHILHLFNFKLISSNSSNIENIQPSYNITYSYGTPDFGIINTTHIITLQHNRLYSISYFAPQEQYSNRAPTINKIVKSIKFFRPSVHIEHDLGLILSYPSDFPILQSGNKSISFSSPYLDYDYPFNDPVLTLNVYKKQNLSAPLSNETNYYKSIEKVNKAKIFLNTTLGEHVSANETEYFNNTIHKMQIIAPFKNNIYNITYSADPDEYNDTAPTFKNIINSMKIIDALPVKEIDFKDLRRFGFTPYLSSYGFKIIHPLELNVTDYGNGLVDFIPKSMPGSNDTVSPLLNAFSVNLRINTLPSEDRKLYEFVENDIAYYTQQNNDFDLIESGATKVGKGNYPAYQIMYMAGDYMTLTKYVLNNEHKNLYAISYSAKTDEFFNYLQNVEEMVKSFEFIQNSKPRTYTGLKVSDLPAGVAINPGTNIIYVANTGSNTVSVLNGTNDELVTNIPVSNQPYTVGVNPEKNTVYVAHEGSDSLSIIDGKTNALVGNISISAKQPISLAVNPSTDKIYVVDAISRNVSVIDGSKSEEVATIATGRGKNVDPSLFAGMGVAVDSIRNKIYVANALTGNITVIDGVNNRILMNISTYGKPSDVAINPFTNMAYFVRYFSQESSDIASIDLSTNQVRSFESPYGGSLNSVAINPLTNMIYATESGLNEVHAINASDKNNIKDILVDVNPTYLAINQDANVLYVSNTGSNTVSKIDGNNNTLIFGLRFYIDPPKSAIVSCNDGKGRDLKFSHDDYISFNNATHLKCKAQSENAFSPLLSSAWSENVLGSDNTPIIAGFRFRTQNGTFVDLQTIFNLTRLISNSWWQLWSGVDSNNPPIEFDLTNNAILRGTFTDFSSVIQRLSPSISIAVLAAVVLASLIPSILTKVRKPQILIKVRKSVGTTQTSSSSSATQTEEILSRSDIITINASVIAGVLVFLSILEGFERSQQTEISFITANIVFPFAISAVLAITKHEKFALRLMIAGFVNLMISVILIALMRL